MQWERKRCFQHNPDEPAGSPAKMKEKEIMKQTTQIMTFLATGFLAVSLQAADEKTPAPAAQPAAAISIPDRSFAIILSLSFFYSLSLFSKNNKIRRINFLSIFIRTKYLILYTLSISILLFNAVSQPLFRGIFYCREFIRNSFEISDFFPCRLPNFSHAKIPSFQR